MHDAGKTPQVIAPPPLLFVVALVLATALDALAPIAGLDLLPGALRWPLGAALGVAALVLGMRAVLAFRRAGTPVEPWHPSQALVTAGLFARIRNPMYAALVLLLTALALLSGGTWQMVAALLLAVVLHCGVVRREERYLEARFGEAYTRYKARVPRYGWPGPLDGRH